MSSGIEFDEDKLKYSAPRPQASGGFQQNQYTPPSQGGSNSRMIQWLMDKGIIKSPAIGQYVLIGFVIANIIITFIVISYFI